MVATRGKKKSASSDVTLEENKAAENGLDKTHSDSLTVDVVEPNEDAQLEDKDNTANEDSEEMPEKKVENAQLEDKDNTENENSEEIPEKKVTEVVNADPSMSVTEANGDDKAEPGGNTLEDDEIDDQEEVLWDDENEASEHDGEDRVLDEYELSEEEASDDDDEGDDSEDVATEEDEVSEEEATKEENDKGNNQEEEENAEQDRRGAKVKEDGREANNHEPKASLKNAKKSNGRNRKKKAQAGRLMKVDSEDTPESSHKKKLKKRVQSMGMIFMCSSETKKDCYQYKVLGLPETKKDIVEKIYTGMRLFLYDFDEKLMYGIYKAAAPGGYNIEPQAFKSQFPSQVRFKVMENCLPLSEEKFKKVIEDNYFTKTKFDCQLNSEQVKKLCRLFVASSKGQPKKSATSLKAEKRPIRRDRGRRQRTGDKKRLPLRDGAKKRVPLRDEVRYPERPRKRQRKVMSPAAAPRPRLLPPLTSTIPSSYAYDRAQDVDPYRRDPYLERDSPYRDRRDRAPIPVDPYRGMRAPPIERSDRYSDRYRDGRDPPLERHYAYSTGRDSHVERRDPYIDDIDSYSRRRAPYRDGRAPYLEPRDPYRDGLDPYIESRESYRDGRDPYVDRRDSLIDRRAPYLERHVPYDDGAHSDLYNSYRRPPLSGSRDVYRDDRGVEFRDSYRRDELRDRYGIAGRDAYVSSRERPLHADTIYPTAYPSRAGLYRL